MNWLRFQWIKLKLRFKVFFGIKRTKKEKIMMFAIHYGAGPKRIRELIEKKD